MARRAVIVPMLAVAFALGTWFGGWWAIPLLASAAGVWRRAWEVAAAAVLSWGMLLLIDAGGARFGAVSASIAGAFGIPSPVIVLVTLLFVWLLAWSAAGVIGALSRERGTL